MNERIGKLAVEAGAHWEHSDWNMPSAVYFSERDLEKFAEFIVRECANIADEYDGAGSTIVSRIKKHFGVEE
jgi:hypothetical protein